MIVLGVITLVALAVMSFAIFKEQAGAAFIFGGVAIFTGIFFLAGWALTASCDRFERIVGENTHFDILAGCFVEVDGQFIPVDENSLGLLVAELRKTDG